MTQLTGSRLAGPPLVGRGDELARLLAVLGPDGPRRVHLAAAPGMGKTAVWNAFVAVASAAPGVELLSARPLESEAGLGLSGLTDLLGGLPETAYDDLPPPQRVAVRAALLLDPDDGADPRALAAGVRTVLAQRARGGTVVVAIDDAHWLDVSSAAVLAQALARLEDGVVRVVVTARPEGRQVAEWLPGAEVVGLPPLATAALFHVVREHTGKVLDRGQLRALERATGGNPLHALEVVRSESGTGTPRALAGERIRRLPRPTRLALLLAALTSRPTLDLVARALGIGVDELLDRLEPAVQADLASVVGDQVTFGHPLHLRATIDVAAEADVTLAHASLAGVEERPEVAVRHRALVVHGHDAALAADLRDAAVLLHGRGAWDEACDLLELAVERTPVGDPARDVRTLRLGDWLHRAGRPAQAERWLRAASASRDPMVRVRAQVQLCQALIYVGRREETKDMIRELLAADLPPMLACEVRYRLGRDLDDNQLDRSLATMGRINEELDRIPSQPGLTALRAEALTEEARLRTFTGHHDGGLLERALELEWEEPPEFLLRSAALCHAQGSMLAGHFDRAREELDALVQLCHDRGDEFSLPLVTFLSLHLDYRSGHWDRVRAVAAESSAVADGQGQRYGDLLRLVDHTIAGLRGDVDASLAWLLDGPAARSPEEELPFRANRLTSATVLLLMQGRAEEAWPLARTARELVHSIAWRDPEGHVADREYIEAALLTGRTDTARRALGELRIVAHRMGNRQITLTTCQRLEVQVLAAEDDLAAAAALIPAMARAHEEGPAEPLQVGLAHLVAGDVLRRSRRRKGARDHLERALEVFESLGASPYADRARAGLDRLGLRAGGDGVLTPNEQRIAQLAADGLRNREIAEQLFVSAKTVEAVLSAVYRKLGVRSRTELAAGLPAGLAAGLRSVRES